MVSKILTMNVEMEDARAERDKNEMKVAQLSLIETENENLETDIQTARAQFFPMMTSDEVDKYMTGLILDYGLSSYDLNITMPTEEAVVEPYEYSEKAKQEAMEPETTAPAPSTEADAQASEEAETTVAMPEEKISTGIYAVSVAMRVGGSRENIDRLIDKLSASDKELHLLGYSWGNERSISYNDDGTYEINTNRTITLQLMLFMCEE